jgi:hypothetical protein
VRRLACLLLVGFAVTGCAGMSHNDTTIAIATDPPGGNCAVNRPGEIPGAAIPTPATIVVPRAAELVIRCGKPGYEETTYVMRSPFGAPTDLSNFQIAGEVAGLADAASGAGQPVPRFTLSLVPRLQQ